MNITLSYRSESTAILITAPRDHTQEPSDRIQLVLNRQPIASDLACTCVIMNSVSLKKSDAWKVFILRPPVYVRPGTRLAKP
eukprot:390665-Rhodomonas_salina.1